MGDRVRVGQLQIDERLHHFVVTDLLPGTGVTPSALWAGLEGIVREFGPRTRRLLEVRDELQASLDDYHLANPGRPDAVVYRSFLEQIGYLLPAPAPFTIATTGVDDEIAAQAGPQLVVPILNARFATNAVNSRWGSLYDALYGSDAIPQHGTLAPGEVYNPERGAEVISRGRSLLDQTVPLDGAPHGEIVAYAINGGALAATTRDGRTVRLQNPRGLIGYTGESDQPTSLLFVHHRLRIEVQIDRADPIGANDAAGVKDIVLEAALTAIMDLEDSIAAVDAADKVAAYRNWLGLMRGDLTEQVVKGGISFTRTMNPDREFRSTRGEPFVLPGRSLMLVRHVGHHMTTDAVLDGDGAEIGEGILDAVLTTAAAMHDLRRGTGIRNSRAGSVYVVKPKMHGPEEVSLTVDLFARVEELLGLPALTLKIGIMDEERRTSLNLAASVERARDRVVFINTGFLDRTGDEIHSSMHAGPMARKADLRSQEFLSGYEDHNVDVGLAAGFHERAQIGKGMWAMPDLMADMLAQKIAHPLAGATTAWVPSPTAATLHATHYHQVNPFDVQTELRDRTPRGIAPILTIPLSDHPDWSADERRAELDTNVQSILGYVVRWVDQGIGCSKVPDLADVALMEDRATLRISSQLLANWLLHGIVTAAEIDESLKRIAPVVDRQNAGDPLYEQLIGPHGPGIAYQAARELIFEGATQPNGYTEPILHRARRAKKNNLAAAASRLNG